MLTGERYKELRDNLIKWYINTKEELIRRMEQGTPPGAVQLTPGQQVERFLNMTEEDWQMELYRIGLRHAGKPDADKLIQTDVVDFLSYIRSHLQRNMVEGQRG